MIGPRVFEALTSAQEEIHLDGYDGLQSAMVEVGRALAAADIDQEDVRLFIEDHLYEMAAALRMPSDRAVKHFWEYLVKGINQLKYGNADGPVVQRPKTQWEKARDGELILPEDI